jgi:hypothetical protein
VFSSVCKRIGKRDSFHISVLSIAFEREVNEDIR